MNVYEYEQLCEQIKQLACFNVNENKSLSINPIEAGQSSWCFEVIIQNNTLPDVQQTSSLCIKALEPEKVNLTTQDKRYFVKYDANTTVFENELKTSKAASKIYLSPNVVYADKNWLVTEYIQGESLDKIASDIQSKIEIAVKLMNKCHTLEVSLPLLDVVEIITHIITSKNFSIAQQEHIQLLLSNMPIIVEQSQTTRVVCHGDINFSNIITSNNKALLIDFECSCLAEREFEVAMFMAINFLNTDQQVYTLACYDKLNNANNMKIDHKKIKQYLSYAYLINGLWYFEKVRNMQASKQGNKQDIFYVLAVKQLSLFDQINPAPIALTQLFT